jgi:hypothetical protein
MMVLFNINVILKNLGHFSKFFSFSGSPFGVNVMDTQRVVVFGKGLGSIPVNIPTSFTILTQNAGVGELKCSIKGVVYIYRC